MSDHYTDVLSLKQALTKAIAARMQVTGWTNADVAGEFGITEAKLQALVNGQCSKVSLDWLLIKCKQIGIQCKLNCIVVDGEIALRLVIPE